MSYLSKLEYHCFDLSYEFGQKENEDFEVCFRKRNPEETYCHCFLIWKTDLVTKSKDTGPWVHARGDKFDNEFFGIDRDDEFLITKSERVTKSKRERIHHIKQRWDQKEEKWVKLDISYLACYEKSIPLVFRCSFDLKKVKNLDGTYFIPGSSKGQKKTRMPIRILRGEIHKKSS